MCLFSTGLFIMFQELDIAIVRATNHVERPAKEKHIRGLLLSFSLFLLSFFRSFRVLFNINLGELSNVLFKVILPLWII